MVAKTTRVWVLYRANDRHGQMSDDPGKDLEGFATVRDATRILGQRFAFGHGNTFWTHPDRQDERAWTDWPDASKDTAHAYVWLGPDYIGNEPDATSEPTERWNPKGLLGVQRIRF